MGREEEEREEREGKGRGSLSPSSPLPPFLSFATPSPGEREKWGGRGREERDGRRKGGKEGGEEGDRALPITS